ncbi:MAG: hypothetical protein PHW74_02760 [Desulfobacca sp.]|nr:hypothetical protein [Desulfobacca sp.]
MANRLQQVLEDANIKLGTVATDILGASGRDLLRALIAGATDPERIADLARRQLRNKLPELRLALEGRVTEHHRFLLAVIYHMLTRDSSFKDLGGDYFEKLNAKRLLPHLVKRISNLGYQVTLEAA